MEQNYSRRNYARMLTLIAFSIGNKYYGIEVGRTMAFIAIES